MNHFFVDRRSHGDENANLNDENRKSSGLVEGFKALFGDVETVPYTVVTEHEGYEERLYPSRRWAVTSCQGNSKESVSADMFRKLLNYISGKNKQNMRIAMTTPVTTLVQPGPTDSPSTFTMGFFIPEEHQNTPPTPGLDVQIQERPQMTVLTRKFGGRVNEEVIARESKELAALLQAAEEKDVDYSRYFVVGYDPPFKLIGRRNEIWFVKTSKC